MKPYYDEDGIQIFLADCRDVIPTLPKVDVAITSPPYNIGNVHHNGNRKHSPYFDELPEDEYQAWQINILNLLFEKCGSLFYNHKNRIRDGEEISPRQWINRTLWKIRQSCVWINGGPNHDPIRFFPKTERLYWLSKENSSWLDNRDQWDVFTDNPDHISLDGNGHTRTFPVSLVKKILRVGSFQTVLDPYMGSGSCLVAAKDLGLKAIGIEICEKYAEIAANRLRQGVLFGAKP